LFFAAISFSFVLEVESIQVALVYHFGLAGTTGSYFDKKKCQIDRVTFFLVPIYSEPVEPVESEAGTFGIY